MTLLTSPETGNLVDDGVTPDEEQAIADKKAREIMGSDFERQQAADSLRSMANGSNVGDRAEKSDKDSGRGGQEADRSRFGGAGSSAVGNPGSTTQDKMDQRASRTAGMGGHHSSSSTHDEMDQRASRTSGLGGHHSGSTNQNEMGAQNNKSRLHNARSKARQIASSAKSAKAQAKEVLSFGKKISEHWMILLWAGVFDLLGLIPYFCVVTNFAFVLILWLYFGSKKKKGDPSDFTSIAVPAVISNIVDFIFSIVPACIATTLVRILTSKPKEEKPAQAGGDSKEAVAG